MVVLEAFLIAAVLAICYKHKVEVIIAPTIICITIFSYYMMNLNFILLGVYSTTVLSVGAVIGLIGAFITNRKLVREYVMTPGGVAYFLYSILFWLFSKNVDLSHGADPQCWVNTVKYLYLTNDYKYTIANTSQYDPHPFFYKVWEYLVEKTCEEWSYQAFLYGKSMLMVSSMLIFFFLCTEFQDNRKRNAIATFTIILLIPYLNKFNEYANSGADVLLGIFLGVGFAYFAVALKKQAFSYHFFTILFLVAASGIKRIGIIIALLELLVMLTILFKESKYKTAISYVAIFSLLFLLMGTNNATYLVLIIPMTLIAFIIAILLRAKTAKSKLVLATLAIAAVGICVFMINHAISSKYGPEISRAFAESLFLKKGYYVGAIVPISLPVFLVLCFLIMSICYKVGNRKETNLILLFVGGLLVEISYTVVLLYLYITNIGPSNINAIGPIAGLDRYLSTGTVMLVIIMIACLLGNNGHKAVIPVLIAAILLADIPEFMRFIFVPSKYEEFTQFVDLDIDLEDSDVIAYIDMGYPEWHQQFKLDVIPAEVNVISELEYRHDPNERYIYMGAAELDKELRKCDYVFIWNITDEFVDAYGNLFENVEDISGDGIIYKYTESGKLRSVSNGG